MMFCRSANSKIFMTLRPVEGCTTKRAARLLFFIQPIKSLICGDVNIVKSQAPYYTSTTTKATRTSQICIFNKRMKKALLHALHVHFFFHFLYILQSFLSFRRREMTSFVVVSTTRALEDKLKTC